jgi:thiol-disulfide isomerase/thioredoxin
VEPAREKVNEGMSDKSDKPGAKLSLQASLALAFAAAVTGFAAVYGTMGASDNGSAAKTAALASSPTAGTASPAEAGAASASKLAAFVRKNPPVALAEFSFVDAAGAPKTLADFKGKTVLLNLWATWCAPCREEMPSLDRLQKQLGSETFEVVALAVDRTGVEAAGKFLKSINVENLKLYADPTTKSGTALRVLGMPTTILVTADGKEAGRLSGPAAWDSEEARTLIAGVAK